MAGTGDGQRRGELPPACGYGHGQQRGRGRHKPELERVPGADSICESAGRRGTDRRGSEKGGDGDAQSRFGELELVAHEHGETAEHERR